MSFDCRGCDRDVRLLENDERKFVSDRSLRTPLGFCAFGDICAADAGDVGVLKLSLRSLVIESAVFAVLGTTSARSPGGVVGCEDNGPPPGVGGSTSEGDRLGEAGGGMSVPSVKEKLTGVTFRKYDLRLSFLVAMFACFAYDVLSDVYALVRKSIARLCTDFSGR